MPLDPETYTENEHKFLWCLAQVDGDDMWAHGIRIFLQEPSEDRLRQLVKDLKSQANDNPSAMLSILGEECFDTLVSL